MTHNKVLMKVPDEIKVLCKGEQLKVSVDGQSMLDVYGNSEGFYEIKTEN